MLADQVEVPVRELAFTRILVPVDLEPRSLGAACYALKLAAEFRAQVVAVHVKGLDWRLRTPEMAIQDRIHAMARSSDFRMIEADGSPAEVIVPLARRERADLIVMPTRGFGRIHRLFEQSVTARVLREAHCPVWTGTADFADFSIRPIRRVLCLLAPGPSSGQVMHWAKRLAGHFHARLAVVHASPQFEPSPANVCDGEPDLETGPLGLKDAGAVEAGGRESPTVWLESAQPARAVGELAERLGAGVLVVGRGSATGLFGHSRAASYEVVRRAPCPVVVVPV